MTNPLVSMQIIPTVPPGESVYDFVDEAIKIIDASGVKYEVNALETTMEGEMVVLMSVIQKMNDQLVRLGATSIISQIKVLYKPSGITADMLTAKYR